MKKLLHKVWITFQGFMIALHPILCWGVAIWVYTQITTLNPWLAICYFVSATILLIVGTVSAYGIGTIFNKIIEEGQDD